MPSAVSWLSAEPFAGLKNSLRLSITVHVFPKSLDT